MSRPRGSGASVAGRVPPRAAVEGRSEPAGQVASLLTILDAAYDRPSWHGPNLRGSLRGVSLADACWRPAPGRHNLWELLVHAADWKYVAFRRLTGATRGSFACKGSNWLVRPETATAAAWKADLDVLETTHRTLRDAVAALTPTRLAERPGGSRVTNFALISGVAAHDIYHAGQIQLLKRLCRDRIDRS